jgi:hypothetical protein
MIVAIARRRSRDGLRRWTRGALTLSAIVLGGALTCPVAPACAQDAAAGGQGAGAQPTEKSVAAPQGSAALPTPPLPGPAGETRPATSQEAAAKAPTKTQGDAVAAPSNVPAAATGDQSKLERGRGVLRDLLKLDLAALEGKPQRNEKFKKKAVERAAEVLAMVQPDATLAPVDREFVLSLAYDLITDAAPVTGAPAQRSQPATTQPEKPVRAGDPFDVLKVETQPATPAPPKAVPPAAPGPAAPAASPSGTDGSLAPQAAPDSEQMAPVKSVLFDKLTKKFTDAAGKIAPGTSSADVRTMLESQVSALVSSTIPIPILRPAAEKLVSGLIESAVAKIGAGQSITPDTTNAGGVTPGTTADTGMPPLPQSSTIPAEKVDTMRQLLVNSKATFTKANKDIPLDQLKTKLLAEAEKYLVNIDVKVPLQGDDKTWLNKFVDWVASPTSIIKPIQDEVEKALDQLAGEALQNGVTTNRAPDLLNRLTGWLKDKKSIEFGKLPAGDQESLKTLVDKVVGKAITGPGGQTNQNNAMTVVPGQVLSNSGLPVMQLLKPGWCNFFGRGTAVGSGYTLIIR